MLRGKNVLLGVTASIAAYKSAFLVRLLIKEGANVKVVMTPSSKDFITPLTLSTLSKNPVYLEYFEGETGEWNSHIELAEWADLFLIAPLTANTMAKMAQGICDNLLLATYLSASARCQVFFAPAMDLEMYRQKIVQDNIEYLESMGHILIPAASGELASGLEGEGRMEDVEEIINFLQKFEVRVHDFKGKKILITAGPTQEKLDPVRYISNHSSGKMGIAIAQEALKRGAEVTLVHGPVQVKVPENMNVIPVESAKEMYDVCMKHGVDSDIIIMSAAVADYTPVIVADEKIKKLGEETTLKLQKTKDILKSLGIAKSKNQFLVGFALETENEEENAKKKLKEKKLDLIVLNSLNDEGAGFGYHTNKITIIFKNKEKLELPLMSKAEASRNLLSNIANEMI